ncbi:MAG: Smr/MutS family protein [Alphaproteobacteria bacterium]|nr:Smr/MutS family protein [Alphaproteobacteria bacterium]HPF46392.1 Smr/MutS family protein [Emcibacteraceae bacterium]HRW30480.1 Smr/MutS family protein [Emcibacteraceae bacterium]
MRRRDLTKDEKRLWQIYTRDVTPTGSEKPAISEAEAPDRYDIKLPRKKVFKENRPPSVSNFESLKNKDSNWGKKLKQGKVRPDATIDLHGLTCVEAHERLLRYLEKAQNNNKRVVLIITGKGGPKNKAYEEIRYNDFENSRGVLRREVPMWLSGGAMRNMIISFQEARQADGGNGALYVVLKRKS